MMSARIQLQDVSNDWKMTIAEKTVRLSNIKSKIIIEKKSQKEYYLFRSKCIFRTRTVYSGYEMYLRWRMSVSGLLTKIMSE